MKTKYPANLLSALTRDQNDGMATFTTSGAKTILDRLSAAGAVLEPAKQAFTYVEQQHKTCGGCKFVGELLFFFFGCLVFTVAIVGLVTCFKFIASLFV
jgi:hypothetical protein